MEQELTKKFKRIIIRGKRGRGVPILFPPNLQKAISFLLKIRKVINFIEKNNVYLFALPHSMNSLRGSNVIRKFSQECGAKNPENITSTRLRKQISTVAQLLNLSESDIEQLSTFLGHSKEVHKSFCRLSESAFQVAKVSKLLLMMEKGQGNEYRGKTLDEININVDSVISDVDEIENSSDDDIINEKVTNNLNIFNEEDIEYDKKSPLLKSNKIQDNTQITKCTKTTNAKSKFCRVPWTDKQKKVTDEFFKKHILLNQVPKKHECEELKKKYSSVFKDDKPWKKIKTYIHNKCNKNKL